MDVFFHWKDARGDLGIGRVGPFRAAKEKLDSLRGGYPDHIWVFRTPAGPKGRLQLVARLRWSDKPLVKFKPEPGDSHLFFDPDHPTSVWYDGSDDDAGIGAVTTWARLHFPAAASANFNGAHGQQELRGPVLHQLVSIAKAFEPRPLRVPAQ